MDTFFIVFINAQVICAQNINLSGKITDAQGKAISKATLVVKDSLDTTITSAYSDSTGNFSIEGVPISYLHLVLHALVMLNIAIDLKVSIMIFLLILY